ncbi:MAG: BatD family protein [Saprospiraceae bacterium]
MKNLLFTISFICVGLVASAQEAKFSVTVSSDSVLLGNYLKVTFLLENANGNEFSPPEFENFTVVSGPNTSSSMSIMNGVVAQSISYTYYVEPSDIGSYYITPASIATEEKILETEPVEIQVLPNPDGIIQRPQEQRRQRMDFFQPFPSTPQPPAAPKKKKKKRKIYRL